MKPGPFSYHDPTTVADAVALLGQFEDAKLLAGGQSLMPMLNMRFVQPDHVVDLNGVDGIDGIDDEGSRLTIGAMTRQAKLMQHDAIAQRVPILREALAHVGHFQTRNRGTIGGSLCHLDPSAELPLMALLYDATLHVTGADGTREIAMADWPLAYMLPNIAPDDVLHSVSIPYWTEAHGYGFEEMARRHGDFAIVAVGCLLAINEGRIERAAIALAGARDVPYRLSAAEAALVGEPPTLETFQAAAALARAEDAMADAYVDKPYRQRLAGVLTQRALVKAAASFGPGGTSS